MKKLKLRALDFEGAEILTREQLKKILGGGMMGTSGETTHYITGTFPDGDPYGCPEGTIPCKCVSGDPPVEVFACLNSVVECAKQCN